MTGRVDFSDNAGIYDRRHGAAVDTAALGRLCDRARLRPGSTILDVGAGTGRVAIPLSDLGHAVIAAEPAAGMLEQLHHKAGDRPVVCLVAEGARLPFESGTFDAVVVARLLYLARDWRRILAEAARVLKVGGVLMHEWGNGAPDEPWVQVREQARALFEAEGVREPFHPGARGELEVEDHLVALGLACECRVDLGEGPAVTLREFLRRLTDGELSYVWGVPTQVRERCLPRLQRWVGSNLDLNASIPIPRRIEWTVHRRHGVQRPGAASRDQQGDDPTG